MNDYLKEAVILFSIFPTKGVVNYLREAIHQGTVII